MPRSTRLKISTPILAIDQPADNTSSTILTLQMSQQNIEIDSPRESQIMPERLVYHFGIWIMI